MLVHAVDRSMPVSFCAMLVQSCPMCKQGRCYMNWIFVCKLAQSALGMLVTAYPASAQVRVCEYPPSLLGPNSKMHPGANAQAHNMTIAACRPVDAASHAPNMLTHTHTQHTHTHTHARSRTQTHTHAQAHGHRMLAYLHTHTHIVID